MGSGTRLVTISKKDPNADAIEAVDAALRGDTRTVQGIAAEASERAREAAERQTGAKFAEFMAGIDEEARAEGPEAVAELEAFRAHFQMERAEIRMRQIDAACIEYSIVPDAAELKRAQVLVDQAIAALPEGTLLERVNYLADLNKGQQLAWGYVMKQLLATTKM